MSSLKNGIIIAVIVLGALAAAVLRVPAGWTPEALHAAILTLGAVALWATGVLPIGVTALLFFLFAMLLGVQAPAIVFSGFTSPAFWLVFGGMVMGVAIKHTGLGDRIAHASVGRIGRSYLAILTGVALAATLLAFLMPSSMGRVLTLIPIVLAMAERYGFTAGRPGRTGMVMVAAAGSFLPAGAILTALVPNLLLAGAAENLYGFQFSYAGYLIANYPVMGLLRSAAIVLVAWRLFKDTPDAATEPTPRGPMTAHEVRLTAILCVALAFWMTDSFHGIAPAWVAVAAAASLLMPGLGFTPENTLNERIDYNSAMYVAAVLGLGAVLAATGLAETAGAWFTDALPLQAGAAGLNTYILSLSAAALGLLVTNPAVPAVLSPLAGQLAELTDLSVQTVLMTQAAGFSNVILPYQAAPVLVGMALGGVTVRDGTRMLLVLTAITFLLLLPLEILWWKLIGMY